MAQVGSHVAGIWCCLINCFLLDYFLRGVYIKEKLLARRLRRIFIETLNLLPKDNPENETSLKLIYLRIDPNRGHQKIQRDWSSSASKKAFLICFKELLFEICYKYLNFI